MIGKIASVFVMLEDNRERHSVVVLPLLQVPHISPRTEVVAVVRYLGASSDPALAIQLESSCREHQWLHAVVELTTGLLAVDDVEAIGNSGFVVRNFEVKPLVVVGSVDVSIEEEVILILANLTTIAQFLHVCM